MSIFRMAERLSGRWPDSQGFCGVRDFDEPQVLGLRGHCCAPVDHRAAELGMLCNTLQELDGHQGGSQVKFRSYARFCMGYPSPSKSRTSEARP